jgi:YegS/Rv2252/BmrU family lipid kinase
MTTGPGDGTRLTRTAVGEGYRTFVAVGGDGTVHEVVNGLFDGTAVTRGSRLAIVPAGTGMDFARNTGLKRGVAEAARRIAHGREQVLDLGFVPSQRRVFVNFMETGLGAAVVSRAARMSDSWPGRASFFVSALGAAMREENSLVEVVVDDQMLYRGPAVSVVAANGRYFGGGMKIAPNATMDDGFLDVLVLGNFGRLELVRQVWKIYPGVHIYHDKVLHTRGRQARVESRSSGLLDLDGELVGTPNSTVTLLPGALTVLL